jgi:hypothetical protein
LTNLLIQSGAEFNTSNKPDPRYIISSDQFNLVSSFLNSLILTQNERELLTQMFNYSISGELIYRASSDGFEASSFHSRCNGKENTVTIIKTTSNSVFGGFTSQNWPNSYSEWSYSQDAFIYSLRRSGSFNNKKLRVKDNAYAIYGYYENGPIFGRGFDIFVSDKSNINNNSYSNLGNSYQLPEDINYGYDTANTYLAGSRNWQTVEIEVYQLTFVYLKKSTALHNCCFY